jgi:hypothetical protein
MPEEKEKRDWRFGASADWAEAADMAEQEE